MSQIRVCEWCNSDISHKDKRARFCSQICASKWRMSQPGVRENLSEKCKPKAYRTRQCEWCGTTFEVRSPNGRKRFCNPSCSAKWRMSQPDIIAKVHSPEVAAKRGKRRSLFLASGTDEAKTQIERIRKLNPATDPVVREKISRALRAMGHRPPWSGGKGRGLTIPQKALLAALGSEYRAEYAVPVRPRRSDLPTCFYIDIALPGEKLAIEVDGESHRTAKVKEADRKKEQYLSDLGWTILRYWNKDILMDTERVAVEVQEYEQKLKEAANDN